MGVRPNVVNRKVAAQFRKGLGGLFWFMQMDFTCEMHVTYNLLDSASVTQLDRTIPG